MAERKYSAFISYRHGGRDEFVAQTLHKMLETYRVPSELAKKIGKSRVGRIFRDVDELPTSGSLHDNIQDALEQSEFLIVICTPRLKESKWCMREIELFSQLRGQDHILAVLAEGEPEESFPEMLTYQVVNGQRVDLEPLAADARGAVLADVKKKLKIERLRLLAALLGCEFDQLRQRDRRRKVRRTVAASCVAAAIVLSFFGMMARENIRLQAQVHRTQTAQSYLLAEYAKNAYTGDDPATAALLALEGLPKNLGNSRPFVGETMASLTNALQTYNYQQGYMADRSIATTTMDTCAINADGTWLAYTDLDNQYVYHTHLYNIQSGEVVASFDTNGDYCSYLSSNAKAAFFGTHFCAIAGLDGVIVVDTDTMEVLWTGQPASMVEVSADERVIAGYDSESESVVFYQTDGIELSSYTVDGPDSKPYGLNGDGTRFAVGVAYDDSATNDAIFIVNTATGAVEQTLDKNNYGCMTNTTSWTGNMLLFYYDNAESNIIQCYGCLDAATGKEYLTKVAMGKRLKRVDLDQGIFYWYQGSQLVKLDLYTGEELGSYTASGEVADLTYCGDERWEIVCDDGTMEYVNYAEDTPYAISSMPGDGTGCSRVICGGNYAVTYLLNSYQVHLYRLNNKTTEITGAMKRVPNESTVNMIRKGDTICLNTTDNSYTINAKTLEVHTYPAPVSFLAVPNEDTIMLDNLDGTLTLFDSATAKEKSTIPAEAVCGANGGNLVNTETGMLDVYSYETGEVEASYPLPENCEQAEVYQDNIISCCTDDTGSYAVITDLNGVEQARFQGENILYGERLLVYQLPDSEEYVCYNIAEQKELYRGVLGNVDWWTDTEDGVYLFLSTTDNGGYILNVDSGEMVLTLPDVSTVYSVMSYESTDCFAMLNITEGGSTSIDLYDKEEPSSPIAHVAGGIGISEDNRVLIYDGASTIYSPQIVTKKVIYRAGLDYVGSSELTDRQREEYHCE